MTKASLTIPFPQATALGLGTVTVGAFDDEEVSRILNLPPEHKPLYMMPVGRSRKAWFDGAVAHEVCKEGVVVTFLSFSQLRTDFKK